MKRTGLERRRLARGAFLIEALCAVLVFSIAAASVLPMLAQAFRATGRAALRAAAHDLASSTLARMAVEDFATLPARYDSAAPGAGYRGLVAAARQFPGVTAERNLPQVDIVDGPSAQSRRIFVSVYWQLPAEPAPHRAAVTGLVTR